MPFSQVQSLSRFLIKWALIITPLAALIGSACAAFLFTLDQATLARLRQPWLIYLLPFAGMLISLLYTKLGKNSESGNNLILEAIHGHENDDSSVVVPGRMAPLVFVATILTHLFGGSAGREGTAVQIGGSMAAKFGKLLRLDHHDARLLLISGVAAGFAGVFGTPLTGVVFAMEVLSVGKISYEALIPALFAASLSYWVVDAWGIQHAVYPISSGLVPDGLFPTLALAGKIVLAAIAFGAASVFFARGTQWVGRQFKKFVKNPTLRPFLGALILIALVTILPLEDYLGLGTKALTTNAVTLSSAFTDGGVESYSWFVKSVFTSLTLGSGFKGGEVTPLFFIGATLGNTLAGILNAPVDLFAALGFIAVFAGATNTPLACAIMGVELFGGEYTLLYAIATFVTYLFSGTNSIYGGQRFLLPKHPFVHKPRTKDPRNP